MAVGNAGTVRKTITITTIDFDVLQEPGRLETDTWTIYKKLSVEAAKRHLKKKLGNKIISQSVRCSYQKMTFEMSTPYFIQHSQPVDR